jgi:hypothetical protein
MSGQPITLLKYLRKIEKLQQGNNSTEPGAVGKIANSLELKTLNEADDLEGDLTNLDAIIEEFEVKWIASNGTTEKLEGSGGKVNYVFRGPEGPVKNALKNIYSQYFGGDSSLLQIKINAYNNVANTNFANDLEVQFTETSKQLAPMLEDQVETKLTVDVGKFKQTRDVISEKIGFKLKKLKEDFTNKANELVVEELGFKPTIRSFFSVLLANTELFLDLLLEVSRDAENYHNEKADDHKIKYSGTKEDSVNKIAYAWPTYYEIDEKTKTQVERYPGTNPSFRSWPEVKFVEEFIKALVKMQEEINNEDSGGSEYSGVPGRDNYVPINAMETPIIAEDCSNSYFGLSDLNAIYKAIGERFITLTNMTSVNSNFLNSSIILSARNKYQYRINAGYFKNPDGYSFTHLEKVVKGEHSPYFSFGMPFNPIKFGGQDKSSDEGKTYTKYFKEVEGVIGYPTILHEPKDYSKPFTDGVTRLPVGVVDGDSGNKPGDGSSTDDFPPCVRRFGESVPSSNGNFYIIKGVPGDFENYVFYKNYTVFVPNTTTLTDVKKGQNNDYKCVDGAEFGGIVINRGKGEVEPAENTLEPEKPGIFWTANLSEKIRDNMFNFGKLEAFNIMSTIENTDLLNALVSSFPDKNSAFSRILEDGLGYTYESEDFSSDDRNSGFRYSKDIRLNPGSETEIILKPNIHDMDVNSLIQLKPCENCVRAGQPGEQITSLGYRTFKLTEDNPAVIDKTLDRLFGPYGLIPSEQKWRSDGDFIINDDLNLAQDTLPDITVHNNPGKSSGYFIKPQKPIFEYQSGVADDSKLVLADQRPYARSSSFSQVNLNIIDDMTELCIYPDREFRYQDGFEKFQFKNKGDAGGDLYYRYGKGIHEFTQRGRSIETKIGKATISSGWYAVIPSYSNGTYYNYNSSTGFFKKNDSFKEDGNNLKILDYSPGHYNKVYNRGPQIAEAKNNDGTLAEEKSRKIILKIKNGVVETSNKKSIEWQSSEIITKEINSNSLYYRLESPYPLYFDIEIENKDTSGANTEIKIGDFDKLFLNNNPIGSSQKPKFKVFIDKESVEQTPNSFDKVLSSAWPYAVDSNGQPISNSTDPNFRYLGIWRNKVGTATGWEPDNNNSNANKLIILKPKGKCIIRVVYDGIADPTIDAGNKNFYKNKLEIKDLELIVKKQTNGSIDNSFEFKFTLPKTTTPKAVEDEEGNSSTDLKNYRLQTGVLNLNYLNQGTTLTESPFWRHNFPGKENTDTTTPNHYFSFFGAPYYAVLKSDNTVQISQKRFMMGVKSDLDGGKVGVFMGLKPKLDSKLDKPEYDRTSNFKTEEPINILTTHNKDIFSVTPVNGEPKTYTKTNPSNLNRTKVWKGALAYLFLANQYHRPWTGMYTNNDTFYGPQSLLGTASQSTVVPNHSVYLLGAVLWRMREAGLLISDDETWNIEPENSFIGDKYIDPINVPLLPNELNIDDNGKIEVFNTVRFGFNGNSIIDSDKANNTYKWNNGVRPPMASIMSTSNSTWNSASLGSIFCFPRADEWPTPNNGMIYAHSLKSSERPNPFKNQYDIFTPVMGRKGTNTLRFGNQNPRFLPNEETLEVTQQNINKYFEELESELTYHASSYSDRKKEEAGQKISESIQKELETNYQLEALVKAYQSLAGKDESYNKFATINHSIWDLRSVNIDKIDNGRSQVGYTTTNSDNTEIIVIEKWSDLEKLGKDDFWPKTWNGKEVDKILGEVVTTPFQGYEQIDSLKCVANSNDNSKNLVTDIQTAFNDGERVEVPNSNGQIYRLENVSSPGSGDYSVFKNDNDGGFKLQRYVPEKGCRRAMKDNFNQIPLTNQNTEYLWSFFRFKNAPNLGIFFRKGRTFKIKYKEATQKKVSLKEDGIEKNANQLGYLRGYIPIGPELWFLPKGVKKLFIDKFLEFVGDLNNYDGTSTFDEILQVIDPLNFPNNQDHKDNNLFDGNITNKDILKRNGRKGMPTIKDGSILPGSLFRWYSNYEAKPNQKTINKGGNPETINYLDNVLSITDNLVSIHKKLFLDGFVLTQSTPRIWWAEYPTTVLDDRSVFNQVRKYEPFKYFYCSEQELKAFLDGMISAIKSKSGQDVITGKNVIGRSGTQDDDLRLATYRSLKTIYDKWISGSDVDPKPSQFDQKTEDQTETTQMFYNPIGKGRLLIDHFSFVNRANVDIGDRAILNIEETATLINNTTMSIFGVSSDVLDKSNFLFHPLPGYYDLGIGNRLSLTGEIPKTKQKMLSDMFSPLSSFDVIETVSVGPHFLCMYVGGTSKELALMTQKETGCLNAYNENKDARLERKGDGFLFSDEQSIPEDYNTDESYGVVGFKVKFGSQNQSHFTSVNLDQSEFKNTQESLRTLELISQAGDTSNGNGFVAKGQSLYEVYLNRSYSCTVEGLGNMMIQPLQYFELENVPMFYGSYLIRDVKHNVTPNHVKTTFIGDRIPQAQVPLVEDIVSAFNLAPSDGSTGTLLTAGSNASNCSVDVSDIPAGDDPAPIINPNKIGRLLATETPSYKKSGINTRNMSKEQVLQLVSEGKLVQIGDGKTNPKHFVSVGGSALPSVDLLDAKYYLAKDAAEAFKKWYDDMVAAGIDFLISSAIRYGVNTGGGPHGLGVAVDFSNLFRDVNPRGSEVPNANKQARINSPTYKQIARIGAKYDWYNPWRLSDVNGQDEIWHFEYWGPLSELPPNKECDTNDSFKVDNTPGKSLNAGAPPLVVTPKKQYTTESLYRSVKQNVPGMSDYVYAAILSNLFAESSFTPEAYNSAGGGIGAYGLAQWRSDRLRGLYDFSATKNKSVNDLGLQLSWVNEEFNTKWKPMYNKLKDSSFTTDETVALRLIHGGYEYGTEGTINLSEEKWNTYKSDTTYRFSTDSYKDRLKYVTQIYAMIKGEKPWGFPSKRS